MSTPRFLPVLCLLMLPAMVGAQETKPAPYAAMAPLEQYRTADARHEIALARSAAPPSISAEAQVLVLGLRLGPHQRLRQPGQLARQLL